MNLFTWCSCNLTNSGELNCEMFKSEKSLIWKIQAEYAVDMTWKDISEVLSQSCLNARSNTWVLWCLRQGLSHRFTFNSSLEGENRRGVDSFPEELAELRFYFPFFFFIIPPNVRCFYQVLPRIKSPTGISVTAWHFIFMSGRYKIGRRSICWIHFPRPSHCKLWREANPGNHFGCCVNADSTECAAAAQRECRRAPVVKADTISSVVASGINVRCQDPE